MKIGIKYMVSLRCKMVVKAALDDLGLRYKSIDLGEVDLIEQDITTEQQERLRSLLSRAGLELMNDRRLMLIERIKKLVAEMIHTEDDLPGTNISTYLSGKLDHEYAYLANVFSEVTGLTISHYIIMQKIERAKELILYEDLSLTEISYKLHYSSIAHLSNQFKKITGLAPKHFRNYLDRKIATDLTSIGSGPGKDPVLLTTIAHSNKVLHYNEHTFNGLKKAI